MIIGTAGHIDHGKTTLVRALTGIDTDRLAAEKQRGISIELGYAYLPVPNSEHILGFVDVPGHEALVHTMVAGATGIEFALLVVAANDGIMPQTREHIAILELLGVVKGCVVITKTDTVDQHQMQAVQAQLQSVLKNTFLEQAPVFLMDANQYESEDTSSHLAQLRHYLFQQVGESHKQLNKQPFRLAIDRSFSLTGHGTIVTGTVFSGQLNIAKSAEVPLLHIMPGEHVVRARRIHAQNQPSSQALMGQRCAINIAGMNADDIQRGQWLAQAQCFQPTQRVDVLMNMLNDSQTELRTWSPVHFHLGAAHHHAHCVPLTTPWVQPNDRALVQLVFDEPVCVLPGDRFIVRDAQAQHTIAGGLVLDAQAPDRKRRSKKRLAWLESVNRVIQGEQISHLLQRAPYGLSKTELKRYPTSTAWWKNAAPGGAQWVGQQEAAERILIDTAIYQQIEKKVVQTLAWAHQRYPDDPGVESSRLRRMVAPRIPELLWVALLEGLMKQGEVSLNGAWYHLPSHAVTLSEQEASYGEIIMQFAWEGKYNPPWIRDIAKKTDTNEKEMRRIGRKLVRQDQLYQVVPDLFYHRQHIIHLALLLRELAQPKGVRVATFRDHLRIGRKRTIQILEFFERIGFSRRVGDLHFLRPDSRFLESVSKHNNACSH